MARPSTGGPWSRLRSGSGSTTPSPAGPCRPSGVPEPSDADRSRLREWLGNRLARHAVMGGAVPRRLNREEYRNSIRDLFGMPEFTLPESFPADDSMLGFDNVGEGLVVSPPLMAQYLDVATGVADWILPPRQETPDVENRHYPLDAAGFTTSGGRPRRGRGVPDRVHQEHGEQCRLA